MRSSVLRFDQSWLNCLVGSVIVYKRIHSNNPVGTLALNFHHGSWLILFVLISNLGVTEGWRSMAVGVEVRIETVFDDRYL